MRRSRWWRTWVAAASGAAAMVLAGTVGMGAADAQESFAPGSGRAAAKLVKVGPSRGSLALAPQVGLTLADFLGTRGRGDVRLADLGAMEAVLPPEIIEVLPKVKVESSDENAEQGETLTLGTPPEVPLVAGVAEMHADAGPAPHGASSFSAGAIGLGFAEVSGARSTARAGVVDGAARESVATVVLPRVALAEGAVVLEGVTWRARHRTGADAAEEASFTIGSATVAGQSFGGPSGEDVPLDQLAAALAPVLDPLGIELTFPTARIEKGVVEMTPLRIRVAASDAAPALIPLTDAIQPARDALIEAIRGASEQADIAILLADILLGVVTGGSAVDLELGGVTATTAEPAARFQFGGGSGGFQLGAGASTGGSVGAGGSFSPARAARPPAPATPAAPAVGGKPASPSDPGADQALALEPAATSEDRGGPLLAVGLAALAATAVAAGGDLRRVRSRQRVIAI